MRARGIALLNLLVGLALALVVALTAAGVFGLLTRMETETGSSYLLSRDIQEAIRQIRLDFRETALTSVRVYPAAGGSGAPGASLVSPRDDSGATQVGALGGPVWKRHVYYTLAVPSGSLTGDLIRWESPLDPGLPAASTELPSLLPAGASRRRTLLTKVAAPNVVLPGVGEGGSVETDARGGFDVRFLRTDGLSPWNPAQVSAGDAGSLTFSGNTRMIQVRLSVYQSTQTGASDYLSVTFLVGPRY